ncbi:MAG: slipin family protein [Spirochaetia bacterium]
MQFLAELFGLNTWATVGGLVIIVLLLASAIHILREWQRGVVLRLGRFVNVRGPGLIFVVPLIDRVYKVPLRTVVFDVPEQEVITLDNVSCKVNAVLYYRVVEPAKAMVNVERYHEATIQQAQTTLRSVAGQAQFDELLSERDKLNQELQKIIDEATDPWGIKVTSVEIKDVVIPTDMQQAIARQAVAERDRRAIVIRAEGEKEASKRIAEAAKILSEQPGGMTLRSFRTASEVSSENASTLVFPLPIEFGDILSGLKQNSEKAANE